MPRFGVRLCVQLPELLLLPLTLTETMPYGWELVRLCYRWLAVPPHPCTTPSAVCHSIPVQRPAIQVIPRRGEAEALLNHEVLFPTVWKNSPYASHLPSGARGREKKRSEGHKAVVLAELKPWTATKAFCNSGKQMLCVLTFRWTAHPAAVALVPVTPITLHPCQKKKHLSLHGVRREIVQSCCSLWIKHLIFLHFQEEPWTAQAVSSNSLLTCSYCNCYLLHLLNMTTHA